MEMREKLKGLRASLLGYDPGFMKLYCKYFYEPKPNTLKEKLNEKMKGKQPFYFVQVGGNDGFANDPLFKFVKKYNLQGVILEPQKEVFNNRLKRTYRGTKGVALENLAVSDKSGMRKLYKIAVSNSRWATGLATFDKEVLEGQVRGDRVQSKARRESAELPSNLDDWITYEEVDCITIEDVLKKHNMQELDLLQIDTEGYDYEIIKTIDFSKLKPSFIAFEYVHLSQQEQEECKQLLRQNGYEITEFDNDILASKK